MNLHCKTLGLCSQRWYMPPSYIVLVTQKLPVEGTRSGMFEMSVGPCGFTFAGVIGSLKIFPVRCSLFWTISWGCPIGLDYGRSDSWIARGSIHLSFPLPLEKRTNRALWPALLPSLGRSAGRGARLLRVFVNSQHSVPHSICLYKSSLINNLFN